MNQLGNTVKCILDFSILVSNHIFLLFLTALDTPSTTLL